jgi:hypothetical protein
VGSFAANRRGLILPHDEFAAREPLPHFGGRQRHAEQHDGFDENLMVMAAVDARLMIPE